MKNSKILEFIDGKNSQNLFVEINYLLEKIFLKIMFEKEKTLGVLNLDNIKFIKQTQPKITRCFVWDNAILTTNI